MRHDLSPQSIRVLVSDDTRAHTELLADSLKREGGLQVTSLSSGFDGLMAAFNSHNVDVLLLTSHVDEQPGRGFQALRDLRSTHRDLRAVMLLNSSKREMILEAFRSGARGVFSKEESVGVLAKCVRRVHEGQIWANTEQIRTLIEAWASSHGIRAVNKQGLNLLSKREMEIVRAVAQGLTNRAIAEELHLSPHTIKNCIFRIFDKLGVSSRVELLLMTLDRAPGLQGAMQSSLQDVDAWLEAAGGLSQCHQSAERGAILAQLALAQYYSSASTQDPNRWMHAYSWYSIVADRINELRENAARRMSIDQLCKAERTRRELPSGARFEVQAS